jgi:hypothetical protein
MEAAGDWERIGADYGRYIQGEGELLLADDGEAASWN